MQKLFTLFTAILFFCFNASSQVIAKNPNVVKGSLVRVTQPLRDFQKSNSLVRDIKVRDKDGIIGEEEEMEEIPELKEFKKAFNGDAALQKDYPNFLHSTRPGYRTVNTGFNGIDFTSVNPADPSLAVGPNHIIQMVNGSSGALFTIYNKSGVQVTAPIYLDNITGKGGLGDPIVMYDQLADRFMLTEFVNKNESGSQGLSIAVSQTNDPTGSWYIYFFSTGTLFPDYPKFSIWPDAYYAKTNDFNTNNNYVGSSVYAFDRNKMLAGAPDATMQVFIAGLGYKEYSMMPVSLQGTALPPSGTGGLFAYLQEDVWSGSSSDSVGLIEFKVDFNDASNSEIIFTASLATASYSSKICGAPRSQCIPQPGSTGMLEAIDQRIMNQPYYRNTGGHEGIVFANIVNNGSGISAVRWYELMKGTATWSIRQQSTYNPDNVYRFMPAISYDGYGNIALAYNVSGSATYPGIRYTGRKQCDPLNSMTYAENSLVEGTSPNNNSRYGDYATMVCDPDGKTFWHTSMYNNSSRWSTRISSFTLDTCENCYAPAALSAINITATSATLNWSPVSNSLSCSVDYRLSSSSAWINITSATTEFSVNLNGLASSSSYEWRVRTTCQGNISTYSTSQFTTGAAPLCPAPSTSTVTNIGNTSATVNWVAVSNVLSYAVEYKTAASTTWITATPTTTALSYNITGLSAGNIYNWRVRSNCTGATSSYSSGQFTTTGTLCNAPATLTVSALTATGATLNWTAVSGASKYAIDYKKSSVTTWTSASTGTTALSKAISSLSSGTTYDWRVKTICSTSNSSAYATGQFTTVTICPDQLESNNTLSAAKAISPGTTLLAQIAGSTDVDYYSFTNSATQNNISISLTNLPANYDLKLFNPSGVLCASSISSGTTNEVINYATTVTGTYKVMVYGYNKAYSNTNCYSLKVTTGSTTFAPEIYGRQIRINRNDLVLFPVPASGNVSVSFNVSGESYVSIYMESGIGSKVSSERFAVKEGWNTYNLDISRFQNGVYFIKVVDSRSIRTQRLVISH
jgi:hypothetical protein